MVLEPHEKPRKGPCGVAKPQPWLHHPKGGLRWPEASSLSEKPKATSQERAWAGEPVGKKPSMPLVTTWENLQPPPRKGQSSSEARMAPTCLPGCPQSGCELEEMQAADTLKSCFKRGQSNKNKQNTNNPPEPCESLASKDSANAQSRAGHTLLTRISRGVRGEARKRGRAPFTHRSGKGFQSSWWKVCRHRQC